MTRLKWKRMPRPLDKDPLIGDHFFEGETVVSQKASEKIPFIEILGIIQDVKEAVRENSGLEFLQIYTHEENGQKVCVAEQLSRKQMKVKKLNEQQVKEFGIHTIFLNEELNGME